MSGCLWNDFYAMMKSVYFIKAKVENGLAFQLLEDLHLNLNNSNTANNAVWKSKKKEFLSDVHIIDITSFISNHLDELAK